ncbi:MAG: glycosyltransferase [Deltaproteobacteria bacterium]|jgi:glycosyltransferase involved in cell wall biosynthesis|nr:glycosyltransferase [Deltaproteobacteria bacterium]
MLEYTLKDEPPMNSPFFSIIIATKNSAKFLQRCLASIFAQEYSQYEILIQDGASTDGTLPLLQQYKNKIQLVSEPDNGIYSAWNKALARASGDWVIFLGSDDCFATPQVLLQTQIHVSTLPELIEFAYGSLVLGYKGEISFIHDLPLSRIYHIFLDNMGLRFPATFIRLTTLQQHRFDESYAIAGDFDFAARAVTDNNIARLPFCVAYMERGGISDCAEHDAERDKECIRVIRQRIAPKAAMLAQAYIRNFCRETDPK